MINLLFVNYFSTQLIKHCLHSIPDALSSFYQVFIVNNSPEDKSIFQLQGEKVKIIDSDQNLGFGKACNLGIKWIHQLDPTGIIWLINPDTYFPKQYTDNYWQSIETFWENHLEISILGTAILTPDNKIWSYGGKFIRSLGLIKPIIDQRYIEKNSLLECDWVSGCSLMINLKNFKEIPYFDPRFFLYYEDFDFCARYLEQGHRIAATNQITIIHQASSITSRNLVAKVNHSSYGYLLSLYQHTNILFFFAHTLKFLAKTFILIYQPSIFYARLSAFVRFTKTIFQSKNI